MSQSAAVSRTKQMMLCGLRQSNEDWCLEAIYHEHVTTTSTLTTIYTSITDDDVVDDVTRTSYNVSAVASLDESIHHSSNTKRNG